MHSSVFQSSTNGYVKAELETKSRIFLIQHHNKAVMGYGMDFWQFNI